MKKRILSIVKDTLITLLSVAAATAIGWQFSLWDFQESTVIITYILSVLLVSRFTEGYVYGILATVSSLILFNWFFTDPYFTLDYNDPTYTITFIILTVSSILTSTLTTKVKKAATESRQKEAENRALYKMTNLLTDAEDSEAIAGITVKTVSKILGCNVSIICYNEEGVLEHTCIQQRGSEQIRRELNHPEELSKRIKNLHTPYDEDEENYNYPIYGRTMELAILRIPKEVAAGMDENQNRMVYATMESTALALERLRSIQAHEKSRQDAVQEHYRGNLLRAISHDLRTPLSGIMGSAEMLMDMTDKEDPRYDIAEGVYQDADWLHSLVENILNLTRLHDGRLNIAKQPEAVEEVIESALMVIRKRFPDRSIGVTIPDDLILAPMDAKLISQVLVNLMDNAVKHTPEGKDIGVSVRLLDDQPDPQVEFTVSDRGSGIAESDLPHIFQMFYTTRKKSADSQRGIGLGLAICQSIVEAHGGTIRAANRPDGGAEFSFTLPMGGKTHDAE